MTASEPRAQLRVGAQITPAEAVHSTPLGYDRAPLPVGRPLLLPPADELTERLEGCSEVKVSFHGKLGDTLLALSAVRALTDWLRLRARGAPVAVRAVGPYAQLIARSDLVTSASTDAADVRCVVIGDRATLPARASEADFMVVCDPAEPPCWSSDGQAHPELPARYYLALERRLSTRLPGTAPFAPFLATGASPLVEQLHDAGWFDGLTIAAVTATSWPERKDYTAHRFTELAERIAETRQTRTRLLLIGGRHEGGVRIAAARPTGRIQTLHLDGVPADHLADLFPRCDLVVGNDTGLTHLAALTRDSSGGGPPVVGLYARHSHSKWRTGWPHHHAVATRFSEQMHQGDLCPVRDAIAPEKDAHLDVITPASLASLCLKLLYWGER